MTMSFPVVNDIFWEILYPERTKTSVLEQKQPFLTFILKYVIFQLTLDGKYNVWNGCHDVAAIKLDAESGAKWKKSFEKIISIPVIVTVFSIFYI